jgi:hypothetical protein
MGVPCARDPEAGGLMATIPTHWVGFSKVWGLVEPFGFSAHGLQSNPSRSLRVNRFER